MDVSCIGREKTEDMIPCEVERGVEADGFEGSGFPNRAWIT